MHTAAPPLPRRTRRQRHLIVGLGVAVALLTGGLVNQSAPSAEALPGECSPKISGWTTKGSTTWFDDKGNEHLTERGVKPIFSGSESKCDVIAGPEGTPEHPGTLDTSGSDPAPAPAPPGPPLPPPPPSKPAGAAPKCVAGAHNATAPGATDDGGATGTGDIVKQNVQRAERTKDLVLNMTTPSRIMSVNVNLGAPESGVPGSNPFEGMSAEEAAKSLYWNGGRLPAIEVSGPSDIVKAISATIVEAAQGSKAARAELQMVARYIPGETMTAVIHELTSIIEATQHEYAAAYKAMPEELQWMIDGIYEMIDLMLKVPISGPPPADLAPLYAALSDAATPAGEPSGSACGQIASVEVTPMASIAPGANWVTITLTGTEHGTLIDSLKAMAAAPSALYCPPTTVDAVAGDLTIKNVTDSCIGTVTSVRLLDRAEIDALSSAEKNALTLRTGESVGSDLMASASLAGFADAGSTSWLADGSTGFGVGRLGDLSYKAPAVAGGYSDALVAAATGTDGIERPFLIKVPVRKPPHCSSDGPVHGLDRDGTRARMNGGTLEVNRGEYFIIDLKSLCSTDQRDSYRVELQGSIPGTSRDTDADGNLVYTWTETDTVGPIGTLTLTAWDEVTGAPSAPVTLNVVVRDRAPECDDVRLTYDSSELKGAPLTVPLDCALPDGLPLLSPPVARFPGTTDGTAWDQPSGSFRVTGSTVTFTPTTGAHGTITASDVTAWSSTPGGALRPRESAPFTIQLEITE